VFNHHGFVCSQGRLSVLRLFHIFKDTSTHHQIFNRYSECRKDTFVYEINLLRSRSESFLSVLNAIEDPLNFNLVF